MALALPASTLPISDPIAASPMLALVQPALPQGDSPVQLAAVTSTRSLAMPRNSGLPWASGAGCHTAGFDNWRGRPSDVYTWWSPKATWSQLVSSMSWYGKYASMPGRVSLGVGLLTAESRGRFDQCVSGAFDSHFREIGRRLQSTGVGDSIIRLGWEMNDDGNPWAVPPDKKALYKSCFQRQANNLRSQAPNLLIEWNPKKSMDFNYDVRDIYPGNAAVDIIGVDYYDGWMTMKNEAEWDRHHNATKFGGPYGLAQWLAFARAQGKRLSVPEWGTCVGCNDPRSTDNPFYIRKMNEFFRANASSIAYETYFNCRSSYNGTPFQLYPSNYNPRAASEYNSRW
jgi:hypothetical protein